MLKDRRISWKAAEVYMDAIMFSYFSPVNNNVNGVNYETVLNFSSIKLLMCNSFSFCKYTGKFSLGPEENFSDVSIV
jgi:hypothetical protein